MRRSRTTSAQPSNRSAETGFESPAQLTRVGAASSGVVVDVQAAHSQTATILLRREIQRGISALVVRRAEAGRDLLFLDLMALGSLRYTLVTAWRKLALAKGEHWC